MSNKNWKDIVQTVLDVITAIWLAVLTVLGSSCSSNGKIDWDFIIQKGEEQYIEDFYSIPEEKEGFDGSSSINFSR